MKTVTIFRAYSWASTYLDTMKITSPDYRHTKRQADKFRAALLARIEAGDRAREALKQVEWVFGEEGNDDVSHCPWCHRKNYWDADHTPDCPRQLALGIKP